jgi:hypothetical protein
VLDFLLAGPNIPYATALVLFLIIGLFEGLGALLGIGLGSFLDSLIPEFEFDKDIELADTGSSNALSRVLGWLKVGKVPVLVLIIAFLIVFGCLGYGLNLVSFQLLAVIPPAFMTVPIVFLLSLPVLRVCAVGLAAIMPKDETSSVSLDTLIGRKAFITVGVSDSQTIAEARVKDQHGNTHYVMVVAEEGHGPFGMGEPLLLVRRQENRFVVIAAESANLAEQ